MPSPPTARTWQDRPKDQIIDEIIARLSQGEPLAQICRDPAMPHQQTVYDWRERQPDFAARFGQARDAGFDHIALDALHIADDGSRDYKKDADSRDVPDFDHIARSKLRVETRLKLLAKWDPRRYGDRVQTDVQQLDGNGNPTDPAAINLMAVAAAKLSTTERKAMIALYRKMGVQLPHQQQITKDSKDDE